MVSTIKLSDIKIEFGGKNPPKDDIFLDLYKKAYKGEIPVYWGMISIEGINPYSNYRPEVSTEYIDNIHQKIKSGVLPFIYVYPKNEIYIMSDDYNLYYVYLFSGYKKIPCYILGEPGEKYVSDQIGPVKLPELVVEVMKSK